MKIKSKSSHFSAIIAQIYLAKLSIISRDSNGTYKLPLMQLILPYKRAILKDKDYYIPVFVRPVTRLAALAGSDIVSIPGFVQTSG